MPPWWYVDAAVRFPERDPQLDVPAQPGHGHQDRYLALLFPMILNRAGGPGYGPRPTQGTAGVSSGARVPQVNNPVLVGSGQQRAVARVGPRYHSQRRHVRRVRAEGVFGGPPGDRIPHPQASAEARGDEQRRIAGIQPGQQLHAAGRFV